MRIGFAIQDSAVRKALSSDLHSKLKSGDAHWVTVKEGPLEGRHLLIDGSRPKDGAKSKGKILAGHGIPAHVVEKLTGATHAHEVKHEVSDGPKDAEIFKPTAHEDVTIGAWSGYDSIVSGKKPGTRDRTYLIVGKDGDQYTVSNNAAPDRTGKVLHRANSVREAQKWAAAHLEGKTEADTKKEPVQEKKVSRDEAEQMVTGHLAQEIRSLLHGTGRDEGYAHLVARDLLRNLTRADTTYVVGLGSKGIGMLNVGRAAATGDRELAKEMHERRGYKNSPVLVMRSSDVQNMLDATEKGEDVQRNPLVHLSTGEALAPSQYVERVESKGVEVDKKRVALVEESKKLRDELADKGVREVTYNKMNTTKSQRENVATAAKQAFDILSSAIPKSAVKSTNVRLVLGKLATKDSAVQAHFTPSENSIYMSDTRGMQPFFHEYGHAVDYAMGDHKGFASDSGELKAFIQEVKETATHKEIAGRVKQWNKSRMAYFTSNREVFARFFSEYVHAKAASDGMQIPESLNAHDRYEKFSDEEMKSLSAKFEAVLSSMGLSKSMILPFLISDKRKRQSRSEGGEVTKSMRTTHEWKQVKRDKHDEYGTETYADPDHDSYPLTKDGKPSRERTMAAWRYIHVAHDEDEYTPAERERIKSRIRSFARRHFDVELSDRTKKSLRVVFRLAK